MIEMSRRALAAGLALALSAATAAQAQRGASPAELPKVAPVFARHGMVVAQEQRAARIGVEVLKRGGNAVDAAVAVGFAMAVTYPRAGNIGGGGFMMIHLASRNEQFAIDYRETAPAATTRDMYLDAKRRARSEEVCASSARRSASPARSRASRWRTGNTARANSRWRS